MPQVELGKGRDSTIETEEEEPQITAYQEQEMVQDKEACHAAVHGSAEPGTT